MICTFESNEAAADYQYSAIEALTSNRWSQHFDCMFTQPSGMWASCELKWADKHETLFLYNVQSLEDFSPILFMLPHR